MPNDCARKLWLVIPAALLAAAMTGSDAKATFTVAINGTTVATDNMAGDMDPNAGIIQYVNNLLGYNFRITSTTNFSNPDIGDITTSEFRVENLSGTSDLTIAVQEDFDRPPFMLGTGTIRQSFTRNLSQTAGSSGTVSLTTTATSQSGGGTGSAPTITFTGVLGADANSGSFNRTSAFYTLTQTITISGLNTTDVVLLTANSNVTNVAPAPAPKAAILMLTALPVIGLFRGRLLRRKSAA